ncbi:MAG: GNAT family protein [Bifidobacterium sp.]
MTILMADDLILRPWRANDEAEAQALFRYAKDPEIGPSAGWNTHADVQESAAIIRDVLCGAESYAIVLRKPDDKELADMPIGSISLQPVPDQVLHHIAAFESCEPGNTMELGFWIGKPFWGRGLVPQASRALINHAFDDLHLNAVWCRHDVENVKSGRAQDKIGFERVGVMRHIHMSLLPGDVYRDEELRRITREQWEKRSQG